MRNVLFRPILVASAMAAPLAAQVTPSQQGAPATGAASVVPAVGEIAPDFTAPMAGRDGIASAPVTLSKLRGKVVVLAFYPADRTSGCTAEMTKFRDDNAKLFGSGVIVLPISRDGLDSHASWAKEMDMPFSLVSDTAGTVARLYGSQSAPGKYFSRNVFIIGKDGKIAHTIVKLNAYYQIL